MRGEVWKKESYGLVASAGVDRRALPAVLVIFIHGMLSGPGIWADWIEPIRASVGADFAAVAFRYPAWPHQKSDIVKEANKIAQEIRASFDAYKHIFVVTHSMGALVLRQILCEAAPADEDSRKWPFKSRVRTIVSLAPPNRGGRRSVAVPLSWIYRRVIWPIWKPIARTNARWGYYRLADQLLPNNAWLLKLNDRYETWLREAGERGQPTPVIREDVAFFDIIARTNEPPDDRVRRFYRLLGWSGHFLRTMKEDIVRSLPQALFGHMSAWGGSGVFASLALDVAYMTVDIADGLDREEYDRSALRGGGPAFELVKDDERSVPSESLYDQHGAFEQLTDAAQQNRRRAVVVTGQAGVGKSAVLRRAARQLSIDYLSRGGDETPLPIVMNLTRTVLADDALTRYLSPAGRDPQMLWEAIADWWLSWASDRLVDRSLGYTEGGEPVRRPLTREWLDYACRRVRMVIIFDSMDEFITRYPQIGIEDFQRMVNYLLDAATFGDLSQIKILIGVRFGSRGVSDLTHPASPPIVISPLSRSYAARVFGEELVAKLLKDLAASDHDAVLTYQVLSAIRNCPDLLRERGLTNVTEVLEVALRAIIRSSLPVQTSDVRLAEIWLDLISFIAYTFAESPFAVQSQDDIRGRVKDALAGWDSFKPTGAAGSSEVRDELVASLRHGIAPGGLESLLARSIFQVFGNRYTMVHRIWIELAAARYLERSTTAGYLEPLARQAFSPSIFKHLGEYLNRTVTSATLIRAALEHPSQFVFGNLAAVQGYTSGEIETAALDVLGDSLLRMGPLARHVLVGALAGRVLRRDDADRMAETLERVLRTRILPRCISGSQARKMNVATRGLAWCLRREIVRNEPSSGDEPLSDQEWPIPVESEFDDIVDMAYPGFATGRQVPIQVSTLQYGYRNVLVQHRTAARTVSNVYYLFFLVLGHRRLIADPDTVAFLRVIFGRKETDEDDRRAIHEYFTHEGVLEEVSTLFRLCAELYLGQTHH